jgi:CheY-like chemotaxis protein
MLCQNILIIEDHDDIREPLVQMLRAEGYRVYEAKHGRDGIAALKHIPGRTLVLLDMMMPGMNGWEFLDARKGSNVLAELPVVVISALSAAAALANGEQGVPAVGYLRKPIDVDALFDVVRHHCGPGGVAPIIQDDWIDESEPAAAAS